MTLDNALIYADGSCLGNPGVGGWGAICIDDNSQKIIWEITGTDYQTTNNRMELMAAIKGLQALTRPAKITLTTDSKYVMQGITQWIVNWKKRGWKTANKKPVKNIDLWQSLDSEIQQHAIEWKWVKGHSGHRENEIADELANQGIDEL